MRLINYLLATLLTALVLGCVSRKNTPAVVKVLPHFLDREGRVALSPSLYDRDAYQAQLRRQPTARSGLRFDVQWRGAGDRPLILRVELRGAVSNRVTEAVAEVPLTGQGKFSHWSQITFAGDTYSNFGELTAWRATLRHRETILAQQQSFLW